MRHRILHRIRLVTCVLVLMTAAHAHAQQSHWATPDDKTAKFMIDMERKWDINLIANSAMPPPMAVPPTGPNGQPMPIPPNGGVPPGAGGAPGGYPPGAGPPGAIGP